MTESAQHTASKEASSGYRSLGIGLKFAFENFSSILALAFFPAIIRLILNIVQISYPLRPNGIFLVLFIAALAFSWQLTATSSFLIERLRGGQSRIGSHVGHGLNNLPKVFFSHALFLSLVGVFSSSLFFPGGDFSPGSRALVASGIVLGFFLVWAPAFVAGEFFSKPVEVDDHEDEFDPFEEDDALFRRPNRFQRVFSGMGVIDLGVERSVQFASKHMRLTVEVVILAWCVEVIPAALAAAIFGSSTNLLTIGADSLLSSVFVGFMLCNIGYVFLLTLPREARDELSLPDRVTAPERGKRAIASRALFIGLVLLSIFATIFLWERISGENDFPDALKPAVPAVALTGDTVNLSINLDDKQFSYRWLNLERFRLKIPAPKSEGNEESKNKWRLEYLEAGNLPDFILVRPKQLLLYSSDNHLLDEHYFQPYTGPLRVELSFDLPRKDITEGKLVYLSVGIGDDGEELATIDIPAHAAKE